MISLKESIFSKKSDLVGGIKAVADDILFAGIDKALKYFHDRYSNDIFIWKGDAKTSALNIYNVEDPELYIHLIGKFIAVYVGNSIFIYDSTPRIYIKFTRFIGLNSFPGYVDRIVAAFKKHPDMLLNNKEEIQWSDFKKKYIDK